MGRILFSLALFLAVGVILPAYGANDPKFVIHPPKLEYGKVCKENDFVPERTITRLLANEKRITDAAGLFQLGLIYEEGLGTAYNDDRIAKAYFERAATQKSLVQMVAKTHLGRLLLYGHELTRDNERGVALLKEASATEAFTGGAVLGLYLEEQKQYGDALTYYRKSAAAGNANAVLRILYLNRRGLISLDPKAVDSMFTYAVTLMLSSINAGDCSALYRFGKLYRLDRVIEPDEKLAAEWLEAAAASGHPKAMLDLATLYRQGVGVAYNPNRAMLLLHKAAQAGSKDGMYALGFAYTVGEGVDKDVSQGIVWLKEAAKRRHQRAAVMLANIYDGLHGSEYIDKQQALHWLLTAAEDPLVKAHIFTRIGMAYKTGEGVARDLHTAFGYFEQGAKAGDKYAAQALADAYHFGWGVAQQPVKSLRFTRLASSWGRDKSSFYMAEHYRCGIGTKPDAALSLIWLDRAIAQGNLDAMLSYGEFMNGSAELRQKAQRAHLIKAAETEHSKALALLSLSKRLQGKDAEAEKWQKSAIETGDSAAEAYLALGRSYLKGNDIVKDERRGAELLEKAVTLGSATAISELVNAKYLTHTVTLQDVGLLKKNVALGDIDSLLLLGQIYQTPEFFDAVASQNYYTLAALYGSIDAMLMLSILEAPPLDGVSWITRAENATLCSDDAYIRAAEYYSFHQDASKARQYLEMAVAHNNTLAMRSLAELYTDERYGMRDAAKAQALYEQASLLGDRIAKKRLRLAKKSKS